MSSTQIPILVALGRIDALVGMDSFDYVTAPEVLERIEAGELTAVGYQSGMDLEQLIGLDTPETYVLTFQLSGYSSETKALSLGAGQNQSVDATLIGGSGTVTGTAVSGTGQLNKSYIGYNTFIGNSRTYIGIIIPDNTTDPNRQHVNSIFENNIIA